MIEKITSCFLGLAIGDALGVPVEFSSRNALKTHPVNSMIGFGVWNQPPGTWSDDSSLAFCLAESLIKGYDLVDIGDRFTKWMSNGYWGAHHRVFDIGVTTRIALLRLVNGEHPLHSGEFEENSNGNGSLMRIIPASIYFHNASDDILINSLREISGITHRHFRSVFSCFIYSKIVSAILSESNKIVAFQKAIRNTNQFIQANSFNPSEVGLFNRILSGDIVNLSEEEIKSSGYVLHTLEASIWCFLNTDSYEKAVLKAVNLGEDTDTTGCVTGGLAGLHYGMESTPPSWLNTISRKDDIVNLAARFVQAIASKNTIK